MALTTIALIKARYSPDLDSTRDAALTSAIGSGDAWINRVTGREVEEATHTRYFDGYGQRSIMLESGHRPVIHQGSTLLTVTESGTAKTLAIGYSTTADVLIRHANIDRRCELIYNGGRFSSGVQNIAVAYTAGWTVGATGDQIELPVDVTQLANEVAWLIFQSQAWTGKGSQSGSRGAVTWEKDLTPQARTTLDRLTVL